MNIYGNVFLEKYILNNNDVFYNKKDFDDGKINLCFITGLSGSGKTSMANSMENNKIEKYELDDVISNKINFSMNDLSNYGNLIYSFFKGIGKKYYYTKDDIDSGKVKPYNGDYDKDLIRDFISYTKSYTKNHKDKKYVIEGIWIYKYIDPSELKSYAVYIKGTSLLLSTLRAAKRDSKNELNTIDRTKTYLKRIKQIFIKDSINSEKSINKYINYFSNL